MRETRESYVIVGDTKRYNGCLIYAIDGGLDSAQRILDRMLNNPNEDDLMALEEHTNIRIDISEVWW